MDFDPQGLSAAEDPYPVFDRLREEHPVFHAADRDLWVVSRYDDVRAVLLDAETFASGRGTVPTGFVSASAPSLLALSTSSCGDCLSIGKYICRFIPRNLYLQCSRCQ